MVCRITKGDHKKSCPRSPVARPLGRHVQ